MQSLSRQINLEETLYALERAVENHSRPGDEALLDRSILQKIQKALLTESRLIDEPARYGWLVAWAGIALLQEDVGAYNTKLQHLAERICQAQKHTTKHRGMVAVEREWLWFLEGDQWLEPPAGTEFHGYSGEYAHMQANLHTLLRPLEVGKLHNLCTVVGVLRLCTPHEQTALLYDDMSVVEMINEMPADSELQQRADDYHKVGGLLLLVFFLPLLSSIFTDSRTLIFNGRGYTTTGVSFGFAHRQPTRRRYPDWPSHGKQRCAVP